MFNSPSKIDITHEDTADTKGNFSVGGVYYKLWARFNDKISGTHYGDNVWEIFFAMCEDEEDLTFGKHDIAPNGAGNAVVVYSTVIEFIEHLIRTRNPDAIIIKVSTRKQQLVYLKLIRRFQKSGRLGKADVSEDGKIILFTLAC